MKKLLVLLFLFLIIFFLFSGGKKAYLKAKSSIRGIQEERIIEEDIKFSIVESEKPEEKHPEGVYVPYYWKSGIGTEEKDYLKGYVPSIKDFAEYINTKDVVVYGTTSTTPLLQGYKEALASLDTSKIVFAEGIKNAHTYFNWDKDNCVIVEDTRLNEKLFVCNNWVNWLKNSDSTPLFVLTDCNIENQHGKCLFLDYTNIYFNMKKMTESRCLSSNRSKLCDLDEYIKLIKYK